MKRLPKYKKGGNTKTDWISEKTAFLISKEGMKPDQAYAVANSMYEQQYKQIGGLQKPMNDYTTELPNLTNLGQNPNFTPNPTFNIEMGREIIGDQNTYNNKQTAQDKEMLTQYAMDNAMGNENYKQQFFNPYGGYDLPTSAYTLGESIQEGDALGIAGSGLKLLTGLGRNAFAGAGNAKRRDFILKDAQEKYRESLTPDAQSFQMGGNMQAPTPQIDMNAVMEALQGGADPNEVLQMLMQSGMSQEEATQIIQQVMQQLQPTEEAVMEDGGKFKVLTGEYTTEKERLDEDEVVAELENKEFLKTPTGEVTQVLGENHERGGVELTEEQIPDGSEVISDYLKLTKDQAKTFSEKYELKLSTKDTYADILHKWNKKSGLEENIKEQEELIKGIEKQIKLLEEKPEAETTINLNIDLLQKELAELEQEKTPLEEQRKSVFDEVYKAQESQKPKEEKTTEMQDGGMFNGDMIIEYAKKHNIKPERAMQLIESYKCGGMKKYQDGGARISNKYEDPNLFIKQNPTSEGWESFGQLLKEKPQEVLSEIKRVHPELYQQFFPDGKVDKTKVAGFQIAVNNKYDAIVKDAENLYGKDSPQVKGLQSQIEKDKFLMEQGNVRDIDAMLGNFTSTRPNFQLNILPKEDLDTVRKAGVNTASQLKTQFPDLYKKYVEPKGLQSDFWLGEVGQPATTQTASTTPTDTATQTGAGFNRGNEIQTRVGVMALPDQYVPLPDALQGNLKLEYRPNLIDKQNVTADPAISEIRRQEQSAMQSVQSLPDAQRAAAIAQIQANTQTQINQAMNQAQGLNLQSDIQVGNANAGTLNQAQDINNRYALDFEGKVLKADAITRNDVRNWMNHNQAVNTANYNAINNLNYLNMLSEYNQITPEGIVQTNQPEFTYRNTIPPNSAIEAKKVLAEEKKKEKEALKKKNGGRIKRKL